MSRDRPTAAFAGLAAAGIAVCCGVPALLDLGAGVTVAGLGVRSWALAVAGLIAVALGVVRFRRRRCCAPVPPAHREGVSERADRDRAR